MKNTERSYRYFFDPRAPTYSSKPRARTHAARRTLLATFAVIDRTAQLNCVTEDVNGNMVERLVTLEGDGPTALEHLADMLVIEWPDYMPQPYDLEENPVFVTCGGETWQLVRDCVLMSVCFVLL